MRTGQGVAGCDAKTAPAPSYVVPDPVLDFRDLCKVTVTAYTPGQTVRVGPDGRPTEAVTVSYTVENPANCDPPVTLHASSSSGTVAATPGTRSGNVYPFTLPVGTLLGPDNTEVALRFAEDGLLTDDVGRLFTLGPCRVLGIIVVNPKSPFQASGNTLRESITLRVSVSRPQTCANLTIEVSEQKSNPVRNNVYLGSPTTSTFDVVIPSGAATYPNNTTWDVTVTQRSPLPYSPVTTFRT